MQASDQANMKPLRPIVYLFDIYCSPYDFEQLPHASANVKMRANETTRDTCTIHLFGRNESHESVCVHVTDFLPSLWFRKCNKRPIKLSDLMSELVKRASTEGSEQKHGSHAIRVDHFETAHGYTTNGFVPDEQNPTERKLFEYMVVKFSTLKDYKKALRVCQHALHVAPLKCGLVPVNLDCTPEQQFLLERNIRPCSWLECRAKLVNKEKQLSTCDHEYVCRLSDPTYTLKPSLRQPRSPGMRILAFDIEVNSQKDVFPKAENPECVVSTIAFTQRESNKDARANTPKPHLYYYSDVDCEDLDHSNMIWVKCDTEMELITSVAAYVRENNIDMMVTHNGRGFDWPFLRARLSYLHHQKEQRIIEEFDRKVSLMLDAEFEWKSAEMYEFLKTPDDSLSTRHMELRNFINDNLAKEQKTKQSAKFDRFAAVDECTRMGRIPSLYQPPRYAMIKRHEEEDDEDEFDSTAHKRSSLVQCTINESGEIVNTESLPPEESQTQEDERDARIGEPCIARAIGIVELDLMVDLLSGFEKFDSYKLTDLGEKIVGQKKFELSPNELFAILWNPTVEGLNKIGMYNSIDNKLVLDIMDARSIAPFKEQVANVTHTTVSEITGYGQQHRLKQFMIERCHKHGKFIFEEPSRLEYDTHPWLVGRYEGACVLETIPCYIHKTYPADEEHPEMRKDIGATVDYNSLYPSIMQSRNLCLTTLLREDVHETSTSPDAIQEFIYTESMYEMDEPLVQYHYRVIQEGPDKKYEGLMPQMIDFLLTARKNTKSQQKTHDKESDEYHDLDIRQNALKVIANSLYGSLGALSQFGKLANRILARLVTCNGRQMLNIARNEFQKHDNVTIVAGDTDSVMGKIEKVTLQEAIQLTTTVANNINNTLQLVGLKNSKISFEKCMDPAIFFKQKMYAYMKVEDENDVPKETSMGLMSKKRGTAELFKDAYTLMMRAILLDPTDVSIEDVRRIVLRIMRELFAVLMVASPENFARSASLKPLNTYKSIPAAAKAMLKLQKSKPGTPWPQPNERIMIVTTYDSKKNALAGDLCMELQHYKECALRGEASLHLPKYISNAKGRFVTVLDRIGIHGESRFTEAINNYAAVADRKQSSIKQFFQRSSQSSPQAQCTLNMEGYTCLISTNGRLSALPPRPKVKTVEDFMKLRKEEAAFLLSISDELLTRESVGSDKLLQVMQAFNPNKHILSDRARQKICEQEAKPPPPKPPSVDMIKFETWAQRADYAISSGAHLNGICKCVLSICNTRVDARRCHRNCRQDFDPKFQTQLDWVCTTPTFQSLHAQELEASVVRMQQNAKRMSRGHPMPNESYSKKRSR